MTKVLTPGGARRGGRLRAAASRRFSAGLLCLGCLLLAGCAGGWNPFRRAEPAPTPAPPGVSDEITTPAAILRPFVGRSRLEGALSATVPEGKDAVALEVNGVEVYRSEYERGLAEFLREQGALGRPADEAAYRSRLVEDLLLYDFALRRGLDRDDEFRREAERERRRLLVHFVEQRQILPNAAVTDEDVRRYYNDHLDEFTTKRMVHVRVIQTDSYRAAEDARRRLERGDASFSQLARLHSIHPSRDRGGELDAFARGAYPSKEFEDAAFALAIGETSPVVETQQGYFVIEKTGEIPAQQISIEDVRATIAQKLAEEKRRRVRDEFIGSLRSHATIRADWAEGAK